MVVVLAVLTLLYASQINNKKTEINQLSARALGNTLFAYNNAVQRFVSKNSADTSKAGEYTGVDWLKASSCGGLADNTIGFLSCDFLSRTGGLIPFGKLSFTTKITYDPADGMIAKTTMSPLLLGGKPAYDISGLAALVASAAYAYKGDPTPPTNEDGRVFFCKNPPSATLAPLCGNARNQIIMFSRNQAVGNTWLRTDHGNLMANTIEFGDADATPTTDTDLELVSDVKRQIRNVARIYNVEPIAGSDSLILGNKLGKAARTTATFLNNAVIIDGDLEIIGKLLTHKNIESRGDIIAEDHNNDGIGGNIISKNGDITAEDGNIYIEDANNDGQGGNLYVSKNGDIQGFLSVKLDLEVEGDAAIRKNLYVNQNAQVNKELSVIGKSWFDNDIYAKKNIVVEGDIISNRLVDKDDSFFYLDPSDSSYLKNLFIDENISASNNFGLNINSNTITFKNKNGETPSETSNVSIGGYINADTLRIKLNNGKFARLPDLLSNYILQAVYNVSQGSVIPKPTCPSGSTPTYALSTTSAVVSGSTPLSNTDAPMNADWYAVADDIGSAWRIRIGNNSPYGINNVGGTATLQTFCLF